MDHSFLHKKKLLLVDDEQELQKLLTEIFKNAGFESLFTASSVKEALQTAQREKPDL